MRFHCEKHDSWVLVRGADALVEGPAPEVFMLLFSGDVEPVASAVVRGPAWLLRMLSQVVIARAICVSWTKRSIIVQVSCILPQPLTRRVNGSLDHWAQSSGFRTSQWIAESGGLGNASM